ncbi:cytoskeleton protein RodZ [Photobacterium lipolyticum]|uniref:Cytoskeleton protein RodZ n=1 Tax=Photobacterium lipolyticum TaxID=266810 RepID=A0A2T3MTD2_9GAMM|nr:cytoskeleton protein RodZ [Photobacterium lipolyticum]PSW02123.1 cytoskeleton protein RodZ [Photobacterium lipolyticum]
MNTEQNEERATEEVIRPGDMLRQAREQLGYSQKDIASRLRLRISVINDIEDNNFEKSQLATFTRGYVSSYAKFVGLDGKDVLEQLDKLGHAQPQEQEMQSFSRRTKREAHDSRIMSLTWALAAIVVGLTAVWWWQSLQMEPTDEIPAVTTELSQPLEESLANSDLSDAIGNDVSASDVNAAAEGTVVAEIANETIEPVESITGLLPATDDEAEQPVLLEDMGDGESYNAQLEPGSIAEVTKANVAEITADLKITFAGDCWVDIRDADGKRLDTGIKKSGDVLNLNGTAPFKVVLGAPGVVKINYKGEPVDLSKYPAGKVAKLKLPL